MIPLQSGSNGNCIYVESGKAKLLFDAGLAPAQVELRLAQYGRRLQDVNGIFISHEHADHVRFAGSLARIAQCPIYISPRTLRAASRRFALPGSAVVEHFHPGHRVATSGVHVETLPTPHDAVDGVVFVVDDGQHRLGICTDFGHVYSELRSLVSQLDGLYLESNYDEDLLNDGPYPASLKARISGPRGHISNHDSARLLADSASAHLQWVCLAHLSATNNSPRLALQTHHEILGDTLKLRVAKRFSATAPFSLEAQLFRREVSLPPGNAELAAFWSQKGHGDDGVVVRAKVRSRPPDAEGGFEF